MLEELTPRVSGPVSTILLQILSVLFPLFVFISPVALHAAFGQWDGWYWCDVYVHWKSFKSLYNKKDGYLPTYMVQQLHLLLIGWPSITEWEMYITAQGCRLRNDLYCVEWDVNLYYTIPYHTSDGLLVHSKTGNCMTLPIIMGAAIFIGNAVSMPSSWCFDSGSGCWHQGSISLSVHAALKSAAIMLCRLQDPDQQTALHSCVAILVHNFSDLAYTHIWKKIHGCCHVSAC